MMQATQPEVQVRKKLQLELATGVWQQVVGSQPMRVVQAKLVHHSVPSDLPTTN